MPILHLTLSTKLWHWDWDGTDETIADPHPPVLRGDVFTWLANQRIAYSIAEGDEAANGDNVLEIAFENEADATAFKNTWLTN